MAGGDDLKLSLTSQDDVEQHKMAIIKENSNATATANNFANVQDKSLENENTNNAQNESKSNLKKNMSLVFEKMEPTENISEKKLAAPLVPHSTTTKERFSPLWRQTLAATGSIMATLSAGMTSGYSATLLPQLSQPGSPILISTETSSWIASMAALPMSAGCIISGFIMEPCGRRMTHQMLAVPFVLGWVLIATANDLTQLLVGRFLTGLCVGLLGPVGSIYIGEISNPKYRGFLLAGISLAISFGLLLVHIIGTFCHWQITAAISSTVPFFSYVIMSFVPESPSWLASKGKTEKAIKAFKWLRGADQKSLEELEAMLKKQNDNALEMQTRPKVPLFSIQKLAQLRETFKRPEFIKPLLIMIAFFFTLQLSGVNAIAFYSVSIMQSTLGSGFNEYAAMLIIDVVRFVVSVIACVLLRVVGRRPLAIVSGSFTALSLLGLATFRYVTSKIGMDVTELSWVPLLFLIGYIIATTAGITPLPWVMTGEVFPVDLRGLGSGICTAMCFLAFFTVVKSAPEMFSGLGVEGTFTTYGIIALIGTFVIYFFLPETKGRTLQDIEESFKSNKTRTDAGENSNSSP